MLRYQVYCCKTKGGRVKIGEKVGFKPLYNFNKVYLISNITRVRMAKAMSSQLETGFV